MKNNWANDIDGVLSTTEYYQYTDAYTEEDDYIEEDPYTEEDA